MSRIAQPNVPFRCPTGGRLGLRHCAEKRWWARQDSNLQPDRYERSALTIELQALHANECLFRIADRSGFVTPWSFGAGTLPCGFRGLNECRKGRRLSAGTRPTARLALPWSNGQRCAEAHAETVRRLRFGRLRPLNFRMVAGSAKVACLVVETWDRTPRVTTDTTGDDGSCETPRWSFRHTVRETGCLGHGRPIQLHHYLEHDRQGWVDCLGRVAGSPLHFP